VEVLNREEQEDEGVKRRIFGILQSFSRGKMEKL
jgi:hypothetical protein